MSNEVMDIQGLSDYLKLARVTLYKMVKEGKIPCRRIGKSIRFPKEMIDQWLHQEQPQKKFLPMIQKCIERFTAQVRESVGDRIKEIRLYGSWARQEGRIDSDIDVAVIVDRKDLNIMKTISSIASDVSLETDKFLSVVVLEGESHQKGLQEGYPFHLQIDREGIIL